MSFQITTAFVQQYGANVFQLAQQKGSRLRSAVRNESVTGKTAFFDQLDATSARKRTSRHSDTPQMDTPHARRRVALVDYDWADLIDQEDKVRLLIDPTSPYAQAGAWALGRAMDDELIVAATATAFTGETGSVSTNFNAAMTVARDYVFTGAPTAAGLNIPKLIEANRLLDANDVDPEEPRYIAVKAAQIRDLLNSTQVTSADYNTVKTLVEGKIDTFMGFKFIRTERLQTAGAALGLANPTDTAVVFWAEQGMLLGLGRDVTGRISERDDKNYATQVFASMSIGATRMDEKRVGVVLCV